MKEGRDGQERRAKKKKERERERERERGRERERERESRGRRQSLAARALRTLREGVPFEFRP